MNTFQFQLSYGPLVVKIELNYDLIHKSTYSEMDGKYYDQPITLIGPLLA